MRKATALRLALGVAAATAITNSALAEDTLRLAEWWVAARTRRALTREPVRRLDPPYSCVARNHGRRLCAFQWRSRFAIKAGLKWQ